MDIDTPTDYLLFALIYLGGFLLLGGCISWWTHRPDSADKGQ